MEGTIGEIRMFAGNFAPRNWAYCAGQLLSISQNDALFSILGCTYGGDCRTSFALPDLRGRAPIGPGQGPGLVDYRLGQRGGNDSGQLTVLSLATHSHSLTGSISAIVAHGANSGAGDLEEAENNVPAGYDGAAAYSDETDGFMADDVTGVSSTLQTSFAGGSQQFNKMPPYLTMSYIICLFGIYPSRN
jgi:microcystin-dependent protein